MKAVGGRGIATLILNLRARHIVWSVSCCSQSPSPHHGETTSDTYRKGGWVNWNWSHVLRREKSLAPEGIQTTDCPALSLVTCLTHIKVHKGEVAVSALGEWMYSITHS
jgi:hypothetical protein